MIRYVYCLEVSQPQKGAGSIHVARQRVQVGLPHAGQVVTVELGGTALQVIDGNGELVTIVPRNGSGDQPVQGPRNPAFIMTKGPGSEEHRGGEAWKDCRVEVDHGWR